MSYSRFSPTDDTFIYSDGVRLHCLNCKLLKENESFDTKDRKVMIKHVNAHSNVGHKGLRKVKARLEYEIWKCGRQVSSKGKILA